jgi:hypothetical protein
VSPVAAAAFTVETPTAFTRVYPLDLEGEVECNETTGLQVITWIATNGEALEVAIDSAIESGAHPRLRHRRGRRPARHICVARAPNHR